MIYIQIDENRFQIVAGSKHNLTNPILVDCLAPSKCHKLKTNFQEFKGEEQWVRDETKYCAEIKSAKLEEIENTLQESLAGKMNILSHDYKVYWVQLYETMLAGYQRNGATSTDMIKTADEPFGRIVLTIEDFITVVDTLRVEYNSIYQNKHKLEEQVRDAQTIEEVEAISVS